MLKDMDFLSFSINLSIKYGKQIWILEQILGKLLRKG